MTAHYFFKQAELCKLEKELDGGKVQRRKKLFNQDKQISYGSWLEVN